MTRAPWRLRLIPAAATRWALRRLTLPTGWGLRSLPVPLTLSGVPRTWDEMTSPWTEYTMPWDDLI